MVELPHDRSKLLWDGNIVTGKPTSFFIQSMDGWLNAMVFDEQGGGDGSQKLVRGKVILKEDGIICGQPVINRLVQRHFPACAVSWSVVEGEEVKKGENILDITGKSVEVLKIERILLNILGNMSGIATNTNKWSKKASMLKVAATRKTDWGLLDKWAVHIGGGLTHRLSRNDALMLKENDFISLNTKDETNSETIRRVVSELKTYQGDFIIIQVQNLEEAFIVVNVWKNILNKENRIVLLLDNIGHDQAKIVSISLEKDGLRDYCILEGSGNVGFNSLEKWSDSGVDLISSSALNRGNRPLDLTMILEGTIV